VRCGWCAAVLVTMAGAVPLPMPALAAGPLDAVLAAVAAEEAAAIERVRLRFERDGEADVYLIDRLKIGGGPARVHVVRNPGATQQEPVAVDGIAWLRTPTGWERSPVTAAAALGASVIGLFRTGLTDLVEHEPLGEGDRRRRRFAGRIAWSNGTVQNVGTLALSIDASGRPSAILFDGRCGTHLCRFRQLFDYDTPITIERPWP
jgi:hypothetical protein